LANVPAGKSDKPPSGIEPESVAPAADGALGLGSLAFAFVELAAEVMNHVLSR